MNTLYCTAEEQLLFDALPASLREGWVAEKEASQAFESSDELLIRYRMANFTNPVFRKLADDAMHAASPKEMITLAESLDMESVSLDQQAELFFVLGTRVLSGIIAHLLSKIDSDEDMEGLASLTHIRRMLFESNTDASV